MAFCVLKSCCGCFDLRKGSLIIGILLLVIKVIWLFLCSRTLNIFVTIISSDSIDNSELRVAFVMALIQEVTLVLELLCIIILLIALFKENRGCLRVFCQPSAICYVIECFSFIFWQAYFGFHISSLYIALIFTASIITKITYPYFLLVVRGYYLQSNDTNNPRAASNEFLKKSKLGIYYV